MKHMLTFLLTLLMVTSFATVVLADPAPDAGSSSGVQQPPVAICMNVTAEADANCSAMASIDDGSYDPDGGTVTLSQEPAGPYPLGETPVKLIVVAANGLADTCEATVTVVDKTPPVVICPADIVVDNEPGQCGAYVSYDITATDNCSITSKLGKQPASLYPVGVTMITPLVTDASGNEGTCSFKVTVKDTERPKIECPLDIVQGTDPDVCGAIVNFAMNVSDNCQGVTVSSDHISGTIFPVGVTTVWLKAKDASGNLDSCSFTVTINDAQKPKIVCPDTIVQGNDPGDCGAVVNYEATATDNCDPSPVIAYSEPSGSRLAVGIHQIMATVTDASGNADTCYFAVLVNDTEAPHVICPDNIDLGNDLGKCGAEVEYTFTATDNCGIPVVVSEPPSGSFFPVGTTTVWVWATDASGGKDSCSFTVKIRDTEPPVAVCPGNIVVGNDPGQCGAVVQDLAYATDNCGPASIDTYWPYGDFFEVGTHHMIVYAVDGAGNRDTCEYDITVNDTEKPKIACPANIVEEVAAGDTGKVVTFTVTGTDNCGDPTIVAYPPSGSFFYVGTTTVTAVATDPSGLVDTCQFTVEITQTPGPGFAVDANPDTIFTTEGVSDSILYFVDVTSVNGWHGIVDLSVSGVPSGVVLKLGAPGVSVPGSTTLGGHTGVGTPEGTYELTIQAELTPPKFAHNTKVYLVVVPMSETCYEGVIVDTHGNPIGGAVVELYTMFPSGAGPVATGISDPDGSYEICTNALVGYVRAYRAGYYPAYDPTQPAPDQTTVVLTPIPGPTPTYEWINLYCDGTALYYGSPAPAGTVIEAFGPGNVLCGQWIVTIPGTFGFMQVYRDDPWTPELDGCLPDSVIHLKVNGEPAELLSGDTLRWTAFGDSFEACFRVPVLPPPPPRCIQLKQGWNLISWNVDTPVDDIEALAASVMPNVDVILSFEDGALTYDPQLPEFSTLHNTDNAHGYWFKMNADDSLCLSGPLVDPVTPIYLERNWNLVGYLPTVPLPVPTALTSIWDYAIVVLGYDNGGQTYDVAHPELATLPAMKPQFGYWIKTTDACTLTYPGPTPSFTHTPADQTRAKSAQVPRVALSNSWVDLYGSNVKLNGSALPVGSLIEAYNSNGLLVGEYTVRQAGKFGFMPIYGSDNYGSNSGADQRITLKVNGQTLEQTIAWTANGDRIRVNELTTVDKNSVLMPNVATLNQNYPNPFNPETTIGYTVGKAGHVELSIYNILGARIRTLVSDYQAEGNYSVKWWGDSETGEKVASGVYFYKLITCDQTVIKSMTLLK